MSDRDYGTGSWHLCTGCQETFQGEPERRLCKLCNGPDLRVEDYQLVSNHWILSATLDFKLREHVGPFRVKCKYCNGRGKTGGGPLSWDEEEECPYCHGGFTLSYAHIEPKPRMPDDFGPAYEKGVQRVSEGEGSQCQSLSR